MDITVFKIRIAMNWKYEYVFIEIDAATVLIIIIAGQRPTKGRKKKKHC